MSEELNAADPTSLETRPAILFIGSSNVGKRTLLSRLLSSDLEDPFDSSQPLAHGWTINTKYYTADVSVWISHLYDNGVSLASLPFYNRLTALVMVFDTSNLSSFAVLKDWVSHNDIEKFEILLCVGNKVDRIPGHPVHVEYRRRLLKRKQADDDDVFDEFGISETEGSSLLGDDEEASWEMKRACIEWCSKHNIEFIEACASDADFDKCLSVDGDSQGVERLFGALSAHMWPGMVLKSNNKLPGIPIPHKEESSEEESDYEIEYEVLSAGSAEPWDDTYGGWVSFNGPSATSDSGGSLSLSSHVTENEHENGGKFNQEEMQASTSASELRVDKGVEPSAGEPGTEPNAGEPGKETAGPWDDTHGGWVSFNGPNATLDSGDSLGLSDHVTESEHENGGKFNQEEMQSTTSVAELWVDKGADPSKGEPGTEPNAVEPGTEPNAVEPGIKTEDSVMPFDFEDLEQLMSEIGNVRDSLRFMPDSQRREMASTLAMKMAAMFGGGSDDEEEFN